jgi:hypothetical protein
MKLERLALGAVLALSLGACAADRNKEIKSAETNLTDAKMDIRNDESRLYEKQAREQIEAQRKSMTPAERADLQAKQTEERAETTAEGQKKIADADQELADAHAAMLNERTKVEADARERLTKAEARVNAVNTTSAQIPAKKRAQYNSEMNTYKAKKAEVQEQITNLAGTPNDKWDEEKTKLEKNLDALEAVTDRIEDF